MNAMLIPDIKHTDALEDAMIAVCRATVGGKAVMLCAGTQDPDRVREALALHTERLVGRKTWLPAGATRLEVCEHVSLLLTLYREHIKAGNVL